MNPLLQVTQQTFAQAPDSLVATSEMIMAPAEEVKLNLFSMAVNGGWIMIPIVLLLFIAVGIFVERLLVINRAAKEDKSFMDRIKDYIHEDKIKSALNLCKQTNTPYSRMIEKGISRLGRPMSDIQIAVENVGTIEVAKLEKGFPWVATTAAVAPMIGFLGTVTGMVEAFFAMANAGTDVSISLLSGGIYQALVTTVAGLFVGIVALLLYNYLVSRVNGVVATMETRSMEFMDLLNEPTN
ncbi:MotA/TolQ/ExbB proton channel family protein [Bacteroidales bacterium OttesenSCG-928-I14]|nr:MotA/TolQ/ExbB proton channel family protein [Bacteroidales bacterium OttesenSCG-928-I14]